MILRTALLALALFVSGCHDRPRPAASAGEDAQVKSLGTTEVSARLVEIPEGATIYVGLYNP